MEEGVTCLEKFRTFKAVAHHRLAYHGLREPWTSLVVNNVRPYCGAVHGPVIATQQHIVKSVLRGGVCAIRSRYLGGLLYPE